MVSKFFFSLEKIIQSLNSKAVHCEVISRLWMGGKEDDDSVTQAAACQCEAPSSILGDSHMHPHAPVW